MPVFEIGPTSEIDTVLLIGDGQTRDCMGIVMRDAPDQPWYFRYRFRYYDVPGREGDVDAPDTKNIYEIKPSDQSDPEATRIKLAMTAEAAFRMLQSKDFGDRLEIIPVHGGVEAWIEKTKDSVFLHRREEVKS